MEWFWGLLLGASVGLQQRDNDRMVANGVRPSWWHRHPILTMGIGLLAFFTGVVVWINLAVAWPGPVLAVTGVLIVLLVLRVSIGAYVRAERRWTPPAPPRYNNLSYCRGCVDGGPHDDWCTRRALTR